MNNAAAIAAQLVDIRNIGTDKCIKLTIHVPAEQAPMVIEAFGWPTNVSPVPVAVARLQVNAGEAPGPSTLAAGISASASTSRRGEPAPDKERRPFASLPLPQQAALLCQDPVFWAFMNEEWDSTEFTVVHNADGAARVMYDRYQITSRSQLGKRVGNDQQFVADREQFQAWKLVA